MSESLAVKRVKFDAVERGDVKLKEKGVAEIVFKFRPTQVGLARLLDLCSIEGPLDLVIEGRQGDIEEEERRQKEAAAAKEQRSLLEAPGRDTLEGALYEALHGTDLACDFWNELRERGADDEALAIAVAQQFQATVEAERPDPEGFRPTG